MATTSARMYQRRRTNTQWASENPTLAIGEIGVETGGSQSPLMKVGDGTTAWNSLPYLKTLLTERFPATEAGIIGTATFSSSSSWAGVLCANASTGGLSFPLSFDPYVTACTLSWGYVPITGGNNIRWTTNILRVNALGFGDLITDTPQTTDTFTQAAGTTNQLEHVFSHPTTFNVHNGDA